jgi:flagellar motor switch protein FliG
MSVMEAIDMSNPGADTGMPLATADAAAILVMLLGEDQAAGILKGLSPVELKLLGEKMCAMGEIGPEAIIASVEGFVALTDKLGIRAEDRTPHVEALMTRALGPVKAASMMERILPERVAASAIELARWLNAPAIVPLVQGEHPQAIAVLLVQLDPEVAAQVLAALPDSEQSQIIQRVATLGPVSPDALAMLDELLTSRIEACHGQSGISMGGIKGAAEIINSAGRAVEKRVMPEITKRDKVLAKRIEQEMFKFEHLYVLDAQSMGSLLREVESDTLIDALKGIEETQRDVFFRAMSSRAADGVRDEIAGRGRLKMADVVAAQTAIIAAAKRLAAEGVISFGGSEDEYV